MSTVFVPGGPSRFRHQREGLRNIIRDKGVHALLFDPGTGKTATTLDFASILALKSGRGEARVLVIAPLAAVDTWVEQAPRWVADGISIWAEALGGSTRSKAEALAARGGNPLTHPRSPKKWHPRADGARRALDLAIRPAPGARTPQIHEGPDGLGDSAPRLVILSVNLDAFNSRTSVSSTKTMADVMVDAVRRFQPDLIVVDESHKIKGPTSNTSRAIARLTPLCPRRILLTGTVMPHAVTMSTPLLTPRGWKTMGDMRVGDQVIGSEGKPIEVVGVWPQGVQPIFKVTFSDGSSSDCTADHLWEVNSRGRRSRGLPPLVISTSDLTKGRSRSRVTDKEGGLFDKSGGARWGIPTVNPVEFPSSPVPLDPYLLGLLLGDGHLGHSVDFTTMDSEIVGFAEGALPEGLQLTATPNPHGSRASRYRITSGKRGGSVSGRGPAANPLHLSLEALGVRHLRAWEKFVPTSYLMNDLDTRLGVLRGLMDSDGSSSQSTSKFVTTSPRLAEDVKSLVRSLGGYVSERVENRPPVIMPQGHTSEPRPLHVLMFGLPLNPFRLPRKADTWRPRTESKVRTIVSVEPLGMAEAQCITVSAENGLYVIGDYVVTHNSPLDVFAQWRFLQPLAFGTKMADGTQRPATFSGFRGRFAKMGGWMGKEILGFDNLDVMQSIMAQNSTVAKKDDVLDLPKVTEVEVRVDLSPAERAAYRAMTKDLATQIEGGAWTVAENRLTQRMRLRQITSGHLPDDQGVVQTLGDSKVKVIRSLAQDTLAGEDRLVIFCHFTHEIDHLAKVLAEKGTELLVITGATHASDRLAMRQRFGHRDPAKPERLILLCQIKTMSLAVNELVTASHAIFGSLSEQRDDNEQAVARLNRTGQTKPVTIWRALVPDSVDTVIFQSIKDRTNLEDAMLLHILQDSQRG